MPYKKRKSGDKIEVINSNTEEVMGTHDTEKDANKQLAALYANIDHISENETWQEIQHFVYNHPVYGDLPKEELDETIAAIYEKHKDDDLEILDEFVDMFMYSGGGLGPNSSGLAYGHGGGGGSIYGYGGTGANALGGKSRQGTRVFGYDNINGITPGNGVAPIGGKNGDPAVVVIDEPESNYEPWKTDLTNTGERVQDIKRSKKKQEFNELWNGPLGELVRSLENYGIDFSELSQMTQEEIQDLIIRTLKKEQQQESLNEENKLIKNTKNIKELVVEMFSFDEETILSEKKRQSRIQDARDILSRKHSQKKALEKKSTGRGYILDQYGIEKLMKKYGYIYDFESKRWVKKREIDSKEHENLDINKKSSDVEEIGNKPKKSEDDEELRNTTLSSDESMDAVKNDEDESSPSDEQHSNNPIREPEVKNKTKEYQARFILAIAHGMTNAVDFIVDEESKKEVPTISKDIIFNEMENRQYDWNDEKMIWLNPSVSLPDIIFDKGETKMSVIARSILSGFGDHSFIKIDTVDKLPIKTTEEAESKLMEKGYTWNYDLGMWDYIGIKLNEAVNKNGNTRVKYGFDPVDVMNMTGRYALKAEQIKRISNGEEIESEDRNDPTAFSSYPNITRPLMTDKNVNNRLKEYGYTLIKDGKIRYWTDTKGNAPTAVREIGNDDLQSYTGRAIMSTINKSNGARFISFDGDTTSTIDEISIDQFEPSIEKQEVEDRLENEGFAWNRKRGWFKKDSIGFDTEDDEELDPDQMEIFSNEETAIKKYQNADWDLMDSESKEEYKTAQGNKAARQILGIKKSDWPVGNDPISERRRQNYRNKMGIHYKFDPSSKQYVKREKPIAMSGDWVDVKTAVGGAIRLLGNAFKYGGIGLGKAMKELSNLTY